MPTCTTCSQEIPVASAFCSHCGSPNPEAVVVSGESDAQLLQRRLQSALGEHFSVLHPLGEGGFAIVFAVFDRKLNRRIAVKVLRPDLTASRASKQRFVREAETVARLNHPHILPIFFVGENQGLVYFGMPLVEGETLEARLRREGRLAEPDVARIGSEIADALAEAHAHGLVHRDIKPLNVMLQGARGRVLVADFGIAKAAAGSGEGDKLTGTGIAIGSPHYMSPEQASGDEEVDQRSDVYSLGILLWQMLAGELPFAEGGSRAVIMQQVSREVPPLASVRPDVSAAMAAVVARCVQKRREDRYQNADDVANALRGLQARTPSGEPAAPAPAVRRSRLPRGLVIAAIGAVLIMAGAGLWLTGRLRGSAASEGAAPRAAPAGSAAAQAAPVSNAPTIAVLPFSAVGATDTAQFGRSAALMLGEALALRNGVGTVDGNNLLARWIAERRTVAAPLDSNAHFAWGLGANQMVIGNYIESGRNFRLSLALYDTHDVKRLWADEVTGSTDSLFVLLDRLATRVAVALCAQPDYNPSNICFDTPARPRAPLAITAGRDSAATLAIYARVATDGQVSDVRLAGNAAGDERASRALASLRDAKFEPARRGGRPVEAWASAEITVRPESASTAAPGSSTASCAASDYGVKNANKECFDVRPVPREAPLIRPPAACTAPPQPANIVVKVTAAGTAVSPASVQRSSGCPAFDAAAAQRVPSIAFVPATKAGRAVDAWVIVQVRPASAAAPGGY